MEVMIPMTTANNGKKNTTCSNHLATGVGVGVALGVVLGLTVSQLGIALGVALGIILGAVVGWYYDEREKKKGSTA